MQKRRNTIFFLNWLICFGFSLFDAKIREFKIQSNQLFCIFYFKNVAFTQFLPKKCERVFIITSHNNEEKTLNSMSNNFFFPSNQFRVEFFGKKSWFDGIFATSKIPLFPHTKTHHSVEITEILSHTCLAKIS